MTFKCQEDSFLKQYKSKVLQCTDTTVSLTEYGKVSPFKGYEIILEETILFPAGGGQPHDLGWLNNIEVFQVLRKGNEATHFTKEPIEIGTIVHQRVNWERRFDHMQQHSGQHLLSAILEKEHNINTTSWWLGAEECHVELDTTKLTDDILAKIENRCNEYIREAVPVNIKFCKANDPDLNDAHTRGLPKDCTDTIRIICMGEVDENMCCGTHVSNLSQLQVIKILGVEVGKKNKVNLRFLVGDRVQKTFQCMLDREKALTGLLKNEPCKHEELVSKLQKNNKRATKYLQSVLLELAQCEVERIKKTEPKPKFLVLFKKESTPEFNRSICKGLENEGIFLLLASEEPDKPQEGQVMIQGTPEHCNDLGDQIRDIIKAKGSFKNNKFQGKASQLDGLKKCIQIIEHYFKSK